MPKRILGLKRFSFPFPAFINKEAVPAKVKNTFPTGFNVFYVNDKAPLWINTQNLYDYARIVEENPVVYSVLNIRASFFANGRINIKDLKTGEIITKDNLTNSAYRNNKILQKAFALFDRPNPLQSKYEFTQHYLFMKDTFGNAFQYANVPLGMKVNIENVSGLWNVWPQWMNVILKGNYFSATQVSDIIQEWRFGYNKEKDFTFLPESILHRKEVNIQLSKREDLIFGMSRLKPLSKPISNIEMGYESENIILQNRGARMIITPAPTADEFKAIEPMGVKEKEEIEKDFKEYGWLEGQKQAIISRSPINVNVIDQDIRKLGIFESISSDAIVVSNAYNVPEVLTKLYLQGATFENQRQSVIRMYNGTTIPEHEDWVADINNWLKLAEYGYEYVSSFDHISELQEDRQKASVANRQTSAYFSEQFNKGACTYNEWRRALGQSEETWGDVRIFDLTPEQLAIIGIKVVETKETKPAEQTEPEPEPENNEPQEEEENKDHHFVLCKSCGKIFDYNSVPESGMGYVKCPKCSQTVTQKN